MVDHTLLFRRPADRMWPTSTFKILRLLVCYLIVPPEIKVPFDIFFEILILF